MEEDYRKTGESPQVIEYSPHFNIYDEPRCFVQSHNLRELLKKDERQCSKQEKIRPIIWADRECSAFIKWQQGFTPKEHREVYDRERRYKFEAEIRKEEKDWQENQRIINREWQSKQQLNLVIVAGVFTLIGSILPIFIIPMLQVISGSLLSVTNNIIQLVSLLLSLIK
jgi:hypothetical protein